jgi:hypothetical protein
VHRQREQAAHPDDDSDDVGDAARRVAAATAMINHAAPAPVVDVIEAPTATTTARMAMTTSARVAGISLTKVEICSPDRASASGRPSTEASSNTISISARPAQTEANQVALTRSRRPAFETTPSLPEGSRTVAASSHPMVTTEARSVRVRRMGSPQPTMGPESGNPGRVGWYEPPATTRPKAIATTASAMKPAESAAIGARVTVGAVRESRARRVTW